MQLTMWCCFFVGLLRSASSSQQHKPGGGEVAMVVQPKIVVPGNWQVDKQETFLFLPLGIPSEFPLERIKIMTNGESMLVVVTDHFEDKPDTKAVTKYKMMLEAIK